MFAQITDSDKVILHSLDSYLTTVGIPSNIMPDQLIILKTQAKYQLYSDIAQRVPRVAAYIMHANLDVDDNAKGLFKSLSNHCMDPDFVNILLQQLMKTNNAEENCIVGAFLAKVFSKYIDNLKATKPPVPAETKQKKGEKPVAEEPKKDTQPEPGSEMAHVYNAAKELLGGIARAVQLRCGNILDGDALGIAACIAMNNGDTIKEIIKTDLPVTADLFEVMSDPSQIIKGALLLDKADYTKLTKNQEEFISSLKRWVYKKLNDLQTQESFRYLVSVYGSIKPENTSRYLIQIKDCGTQYSNLLIVAKQLINN